MSQWGSKKARLVLAALLQIEESAHRGLPFSLKVADGDRYDEPHREYISLPPKESATRTYFVVHRDDGNASILPLIAITSLTFKVDAGAT
jgi:hypothetical protein